MIFSKTAARKRTLVTIKSFYVSRLSAFLVVATVLSGCATMYQPGAIQEVKELKESMAHKDAVGFLQINLRNTHVFCNESMTHKDEVECLPTDYRQTSFVCTERSRGCSNTWKRTVDSDGILFVTLKRKRSSCTGMSQLNGTVSVPKWFTDDYPAGTRFSWVPVNGGPAMKVYGPWEKYEKEMHVPFDNLNCLSATEKAFYKGGGRIVVYWQYGEKDGWLTCTFTSDSDYYKAIASFELLSPMIKIGSCE